MVASIEKKEKGKERDEPFCWEQMNIFFFFFYNLLVMVLSRFFLLFEWGILLKIKGITDSMISCPTWEDPAVIINKIQKSQTNKFTCKPNEHIFSCSNDSFCRITVMYILDFKTFLSNKDEGLVNLSCKFEFIHLHFLSNWILNFYFD